MQSVTSASIRKGKMMSDELRVFFEDIGNLWFKETDEDDVQAINLIFEKLNQAANERQAQIVKWLRDAFDQDAEDLCTKILQINREQRAQNVFAGQPYFDAFADAIERGDHLND